MFFRAMADAIASPEGLHDEEEERENRRGNFRVDEEEPMQSPFSRMRTAFSELTDDAMPNVEGYGIKEKESGNTNDKRVWMDMQIHKFSSRKEGNVKLLSCRR